MDIAMPPSAQAALSMMGQDAGTAEIAARLKHAGQSKDMKKIDEAARDFEAMFLSEMIKPMFEGLEVNEEFGGGKGEEIFRGLMLQEYGKIMAQAGGIGLASHIRAEMLRLQEGSGK